MNGINSSRCNNFTVTNKSIQPANMNNTTWRMEVLAESCNNTLTDIPSLRCRTEAWRLTGHFPRDQLTVVRLTRGDCVVGRLVLLLLLMYHHSSAVSHTDSRRRCSMPTVASMCRRQHQTVCGGGASSSGRREQRCRQWQRRRWTDRRGQQQHTPRYARSPSQHSLNYWQHNLLLSNNINRAGNDYNFLIVNFLKIND